MPDRSNRIDIDGRRREAPGRRAAVLPFLAAVCLLALAPAGLLAPAAEARPAPPEAGVADTAVTAGAPSLILEVPAYLPVEPPGGYRRALEGGTRAADGLPGPLYWQQRVDYSIEAVLDPEDATLRGRQRVRYENRSPDVLPGLVVKLYQNVFSKGERRNRRVELTGGIRLARVEAQGQELRELTAEDLRRLRPGERPPPGYLVEGTVAQIVLPEAILPEDGTELAFEWEFRVPGDDAFRMGHLDGRVFSVAQWYPQVATYDDVRGWDFDPYLGDGEFYLEYGDFEVSVTVPEGWLVTGTGELVNAAERLPPEALGRLETALASDTVVRVTSAPELLPRGATEGREGTGDEAAGRPGGAADGPGDEPPGVTWRFRAENVRDFAFAASDLYVWDSVGAEVGGEVGRSLVSALYDPELAHWQQAALYSKHALELFSSYLLPYPWPHASAAYGPVGGMEYPMLVFIGRSAPGEPLYRVLAHELAHQWFPMLVGSPEAPHAWMDEGLSTFLEGLALEDFFGTAEMRERDMALYLRAVEAEVEVPIMRHADYAEDDFGRAVAAYIKPALLLHALRGMLGAEVFDAALRDYTEAWSWRHPYPWDLFAVLEGAAGEPLDWFWRPWFYETWTLDQAVESVRLDGDSVRIRVANRGQVVMPVELEVEFADGTVRRESQPAEIWAGTRRAELGLSAPAAPVRVTLDPEGWWPDVDRAAGEWRQGDPHGETAAPDGTGERRD